ncbi:MAG: MFS transporter [Dehalococcoidia bacterium]
MVTEHLEVQPQGTTVAGASISSYRWVVIGAVVASTWAMTLPSLSFGLLLPAIRDTLDLSRVQSGWLGSSLRIGNVLVTVPAAVVLSRFNPVRLVMLSIGLGAAFTFLHGLAPVFAVLFIARMGFGLSFSLRVPARALLAQQWFPLREIPLVNGLIIGLGSIAEIVALGLTPVILDATGSWRITYHIYGLFGVAVLLLWAVFARTRETPDFRQRIRAEGRGAIREALRHRSLWLIGLGSMGAALGWWAFAVFWPTYMLEENDFSLQRTGLLFSLISAGTIPSSVFFGFLGSRIRRRKALIMISGLTMAAGSFGLLLTTEMWLLVLMALLVGVSWGHLPIALSIPYEIPGIQPREIVVGLSLITTLLMIGGILGPLVAGAVSDVSGSLFLALVVGAATPLSMTVMAAFLRDRDREPLPTLGPHP